MYELKSLLTLILILSIPFSISAAEVKCAKLFIHKNQPLLRHLDFAIQETREEGYIFPNENHPELFLELLGSTKVPKGLVVSTGFERSFMDAAMLPKATGLLVLDFHSPIIKAVDWNVQLLKAIAETPEAYPEVRRSRIKQAEWKLDERIKNWEEIDSTDLLVSSQTHWEIFFGPKGLFPPEVNYWTEPTPRQRVINLAIKNRITARQVDFLDIERLTLIGDALVLNKEKISVLDISNVFSRYFNEFGLEQGASHVRQTLNALLPAIHSNGVLFYTYLSTRIKNDRFDYGVIPIKSVLKLSDQELLDTFSPRGMNTMKSI